MYDIPRWLLVLASCATFLHDGHGEPALRGTPAHFVVEPVHAWPLASGVVLLLAVVVLVVRRARGRRRRT